MKRLVMKMQEQFVKMCATGKLFRSKITGDEIYTLYLQSFPAGTNPVFRDPASTTHNCNNCKNFIRRYGNIVSISEDGALMSVFGNDGIEEPYKRVAAAMNSLVMKSAIQDVFFESYNMLDQKLNYEKCKKNQDNYKLGTAENYKQYTKEEADKYGVVSPGEIKTFTHMNVSVPKAFVIMDNRSVEAVTGIYRDKYSVFKRAMEEISLDTLNLVEDLIVQESLLDGTSHLHTIKDAIKYKKLYNELKTNKENWLWATSYSLEERVAKFRNTLIGVLCSELAEGKELNAACESWNKRVDPVNYMKASAPITKKQIAEAQKFVEENGYEESFNRRLATIDDIKVSEIKYSDVGDRKIKKVTVFDQVKATSIQHKRAKFDKVEEVSIEKFMEDILPKCTSIEAMLLNSHQGNLVTLTTSDHNEGKPMFKWNNNYSWNFNGNLAGKSQIKEAVNVRGGKIDGVLRFSIMWAEGSLRDNSDLDAWCMEPNRNAIGFDNKVSVTGGNLDVDIMHPYERGNKNIVENITWPDIKRMKDGTYKFWVNQFKARSSEGFTAEIEFNGEIYTYEFKRGLLQQENIQVAEVTLKDGQFTIKHILPVGESNKTLWALETNNFHKVNLVCLSPNHWGENAVGNKHYFFMLEDCKTDKDVRGFHNENLLPELLKHKRVIEVLGNSNLIKVAQDTKQISGIGFNSTVRDEVVLKLGGSFKRVIKVRF